MYSDDFREIPSFYLKYSGSLGLKLSASFISSQVIGRFQLCQALKVSVEILTKVSIAAKDGWA